MKLPRVRIGTLMLLVVIAALTVALAIETRRRKLAEIKVQATRELWEAEVYKAERISGRQ